MRIRVGQWVHMGGRHWKVKTIDKVNKTAVISRRYLDGIFGPNYAQTVYLSQLKTGKPTIRGGKIA